MNTPESERTRSAVEASLMNADRDFSDVECIHGHFLPFRYLLRATRQKLTFVTWLRDPVQRLLSNYAYWRKTYDRESSPALHRRVVEEGWSIERFCLGPEMRNMYAQFLWGFPVENFDFIGVTEYYEEDLAYFASRFLGVSVQPQRLNVGDADGRPYLIDKHLHERIEAFHDRDVDLYRFAVEKRGVRLTGERVLPSC